MSVESREALWRELQAGGAAQGELPATGAAAPWFVRLMLGIAGWIAATFLFGFIQLGFGFIMESTSALLVVGTLACTGAALVFRAGRHGDLLAQFALAVSLAGQGLLVAGFGKAFHGSETAAAAAVAVQQAILFLAVPPLVHRVWTAASGAFACMLVLGRLGLGAYSTPVLTAACALVWLHEFDDARRAEGARAAGYGLGVTAMLSVVMHGSWIGLLWGRDAGPPHALYFWSGALANAAVVLWSAVALLRREGVPPGSHAGRVALLGACIAAAMSLKAPGVAPATLLLVLGYANANRVLAGFGIFALIAYLSYYYYSLQATLLEKSALLALAGIGVLVARLAMQRLLPGRGAGSA